MIVCTIIQRSYTLSYKNVYILSFEIVEISLQKCQVASQIVTLETGNIIHHYVAWRHLVYFHDGDDDGENDDDTDDDYD